MNKKCDDSIISLTQEISKMILENNQNFLNQQTIDQSSD